MKTITINIRMILFGLILVTVAMVSADKVNAQYTMPPISPCVSQCIKDFNTCNGGGWGQMNSDKCLKNLNTCRSFCEGGNTTTVLEHSGPAGPPDTATPFSAGYSWSYDEYLIYFNYVDMYLVKSNTCNKKNDQLII